MIAAHDAHGLEGAVARLQKELPNINRQPRPRFWPAPLKLSVSGMNPEDGGETRGSVFSLRLSELVVSIQPQTVIPIRRASVTSSRLWLEVLLVTA
jgi:hypothetical protein